MADPARPPVDAAAWQPWLEHVCAALEVDPVLVDVAAVHALAGVVADEVARPMGPVAAHIWGLARGAYPDTDPAALRGALEEAARG